MDVLQEASAAALADVNALNAVPDGASEASPDTASTSETPAAAVAAPVADATPTDASATPATPEEELELTWKGQQVRLSKSDAIKLAQQGYDYTHKTMTLAEERRAFETEKLAVQGELQRQLLMIKDTLTNPDSMKELVQWAAQQQGYTADQVMDAAQGQGTTPGLTAQQAQAMIQQQVGQLQRQFNTEIRRANHELETVRLEKEYSASINTHVKDLIKTNPILDDVDGIVDVLRSEVAAQVKARIEVDPNRDIPIGDTLQMFTKAAERRVAKLEARFQNRMKESAVRQAQVLTKGPEPAGGTTPTPTPSQPLKLGSAELRAAVLADLVAGS